MPSIPGFWEGGPHDPINIEESWRDFVRSINAHVVEDLVPEPRNFENADFLFQEIHAVAELKEIQTEFSKADAFHDGFESLMERLLSEDPDWRPTLLGGSGYYPNWFKNDLIRLFRPPISRILKKANRQIKDTKHHFKINAPTGILILVNDGFTSLEPHFVRHLACNLLQNSYSSIDCFL